MRLILANFLLHSVETSQFWLLQHSQLYHRTFSRSRLFSFSFIQTRTAVRFELKHFMSALSVFPDMETSDPVVASRPPQVTGDLFDIMSGQTDVDHPLCEECTDTLLDHLDTQLNITENECQNYKYDPKRCLTCVALTLKCADF